MRVSIDGNIYDTDKHQIVLELEAQDKVNLSGMELGCYYYSSTNGEDSDTPIKEAAENMRLTR